MNCIKCGKPLSRLHCDNCEFEITANELLFIRKLGDEDVLKLTKFIESASSNDISKETLRDCKHSENDRIAYATGSEQEKGGMVNSNQDNESQINDNSTENGFRRVVLKNGDVYEGIWENGKYNGYGKMIYANGVVYEGEWENGKPRGLCKLKLANGDVLEGIFSYFGISYGKRLYTNGDIYEGHMHNHKPNDDGKMIYANGDIYVGKWKEGKRDGYGKLTLANGKVKAGEWKKDKFLIVRNAVLALLYKK